jgi:hypothetical protein
MLASNKAHFVFLVSHSRSTRAEALIVDLKHLKLVPTSSQHVATRGLCYSLFMKSLGITSLVLQVCGTDPSKKKSTSFYNCGEPT